MKEQPKIICEDCGNEIPEGAETCPVLRMWSRLKLRKKPIPVYLQPGVKVSTLKIGQSVLLSFLVLIGGGIAASKAIAKKAAERCRWLKSVLIIKQTTHLLWLCILAQQNETAEVLSKAYDIMPFGINTTGQYAPSA